MSEESSTDSMLILQNDDGEVDSTQLRVGGGLLLSSTDSDEEDSMAQSPKRQRVSTDAELKARESTKDKTVEESAALETQRIGDSDKDEERNGNGKEEDAEQLEEMVDGEGEGLEVTNNQAQIPLSPSASLPASMCYPDMISCRSVDKCYERLNRIDEGAYGVVYRAKDKETGEIVALKRIKMDKFTEGFPITTIREILTLISHPHLNIVRVKEVVVGPKLTSVFLVMEFVEHELRSLMEDMVNPFSPSEVKCLMLQLLRGVAHMHSYWMVHRDLKTSNILLNNSGILKIADFGLARTYGSPLKNYTLPVVTLAYRSPELLFGERKYSTAVDIWSCGCIFAELLHNKVMLLGRGEVDQVKQIFNLLGTPDESVWPGMSELPDIKKFNLISRPRTFSKRFKKLSPAAYDLLERLLTYDPKQRITAREALNHPYFTQEMPPAQDPSMMPTFPSRAEGMSRKRKHQEILEGTAADESGGGGLFQGQGSDDAYSSFTLRM